MSPRPETPPVFATSLAAALVAAGWVVAVVPDSRYFVLDPDGGLFIQAAYDWRHAGLIPQVDVFSSYGPLSYVPRVIAQALLGDRLIAEVLLAAVAYGIAYGLFFGVCRDLSGTARVAWALLAVGLVCLPRYYKWPVVLIPALTGSVAVRLTTGPLGRSTAMAAGSTLGLAWLFRHDYLAYSGCVVGLAWWLRSRHEPTIWRLLPSAAFGFATLAGPWFAVLVITRGLGSYVLEIAGVTGTHAVGLGLPHPLIDWTSPRLTTLFAAAYALTALAAWHLVSTARSVRPARDLAWVALGLSVAFLPQSMHRADAGHLLQVLPGALMGIAALARRPVGASAAALLIGVLLWTGATLGIVTRPGLGWESVPTSLRAALVPAADILSVSDVTAPPVPVDALGFLRSCVPADTAVAVYPFAPQLAWLSGRVQGGPFLVLVPGYYDDDASEQVAIDRLRRDTVSVVLWDERFQFDGRPERRSVETHRMLYEGVRRQFVRDGLVDEFAVFIDPRHAGTVKPCLEARRAKAVEAIPRYDSTLAEGVKFWQPGWPTFLADATGLAPQESWGRWTDGPVSVLTFSRPLPAHFTLVVTAAAHGPNLGRPVQFSVGPVTRTATFTAELGRGAPDVRRLDFDLEAASDTLEIRPPNPAPPGAGDRRQVGLALIRLQIDVEP